MKMCHCWADTRGELFVMMTKIGVQIKWFQRPDYIGGIGMNASWEHFDISMSKRALAVQHGAVEVDMYTMAEHANRQQFLARVERGEFDLAIYPLRMWQLCGSRNR
jgi:hypothetical protein